MAFIRRLLTLVCLLCLWQAVIWVGAIPSFILPSPAQVFARFISDYELLTAHAMITLGETLSGLCLGVLLGMITALLMMTFAPLRRFLLSLLVTSQALPFFALAPILTLWLGFGMGAKIAVVILMVYVTIASTFYDGLSKTSPVLIDLGLSLRARPWRFFWLIRFPAALPALASGLRLAVIYAPVGAVVGEWIGSSAGLGYLMLRANGEGQTDLLFSALAFLVIITLSLSALLSHALRILPPLRHSHLSGG